MYEINVTYKGVVPMMHHRFADPAQTEKPKRKRAKGRNEDDILAALHHDKKGVYVPADNIRMMLIGNKHRRGAAKILGSEMESGKGTEYTSICKGCIWVIGPDDPLKVYVDPQRKTYDDVDERAFITATGARSMAYRPIITLPWEISFIVQVTQDSVEESKVRQLFDVAGLRCGCCAYGPTFGRCLISKWEPKTTLKAEGRSDRDKEPHKGKITRKKEKKEVS